ITIKPKTQKQMNLVVGDDVTSEKPFKLIEKSALLDHIQNVEDSDFLPIRAQIEQYPEEEILMGYVINEQNTDDEFYFLM
ncbi:dynein axonemal intermediate chain 3-like, partial [Chrysoperla carnea]|uniref:dynein axonemal intermediate chain 3-like n=1 Tax=Chrysoperla carnea TaxID=189513 RepID=UPI001D07471D